MEPIDRLRELLTVAESGKLGALGSWLEPRLRNYLTRASEGVTLDQSLEVAVGPGESPWYTREAMAARDDAIRKLASQHFGNLDLSGQADAIAQAIRRYRRARWRFDKLKECMPETYTDTPSESLYEVLCKGDGDAPQSKRHLRRILEGTK